MITPFPADGAKSLSISLVSYKSDALLLLRTLTSLKTALDGLQQQLQVNARLTIVDNGAETEKLAELSQKSGLQSVTEIISNERNVGFGAANNQVIRNATSEFHLILNPDVELAADALTAAVQYLRQHPQVVAVSPSCRNAGGKHEFLCKHYPALGDLLLRGFAPHSLKQYFRTRLAHYEYQHLVEAKSAAAVELISGCFMLCRTIALQKAGGFNERFFLYFEDFALSLELGKLGELHYVPASKIVHHGGGAARKGLKHIRYFFESACRFYQHYGWKFW